MHGWDFWNNPLVVSAFRVKYRKRSPTILAALYVMALVGVGMMLYTYYPKTNPHPVALVYLLIIFGLQFAISSIWTMIAAGSSLQAEVANRTLDFQRIVSLSPRQIMLGKLLGEPAECFLLAISTLPLTLWCVAEGAAPIGVWVLLYVQLATMSLAAGAVGLLQNLEPPAGKPVGTRQGSVWGSLIFVMVFSIPSLLGNLPFLTRQPWTQALLGLFTPILVLRDVLNQQAAGSQLSWIGWRVPYLFAAPIAQAGLAALAFEAASRRLAFPRNPLVSKRRALAVLLAFDLLAAGIVWDDSLLLHPIDQRIGSFVLAHVLVGFLATLWITPQRDAVWSWIWRFKGQRSLLPDLLWGNRTQSMPSVLLFGAIGLAVAAMLVWLPASRIGGTATVDTWLRAALAVAIYVAWSWTYQYFIIASGRGGRMLFFLVFVMALVLPWMAGAYFENDWISSFSPAVFFARWVDGSPQRVDLAPLAAVSALLALVSIWDTRRRTVQYERVVDERLRGMGVRQ